MIQDGQTIAVWFSCGAASAVAAKKTIELYGDRCKIRVVNNPVAEEDRDNQRFLKDVEKWLGLPIEFAINSKYPNCSAVEVWDKRRFMGSTKGAPCTLELKKEARYEWERNNHADWHVLGFTVDEWERARNFARNERPNLLWTLGHTFLTKDDCFKIVEEAGLELPKVYKLGYPNANCIGCIKATSPTYWNHVRQNHPAIFAHRAKQSREIGARLVRVKNERIFLDELDPLAKGNSMKGMNFECGIFCEEKQ